MKKMRNVPFGTNVNCPQSLAGNEQHFIHHEFYKTFCPHIGYYYFIIWQYTFIKLFVFFLFLRWCIDNRIFYFLSLLRRLTFNIIRLLPPLTLLDPLKPFDKWEGQITPCEIHTLAKGKVEVIGSSITLLQIDVWCRKKLGHLQNAVFVLYNDA